MFTLDLTNTIFLVCALAGGVLLLVTILLDDILGGALDSIGFSIDLGGVSLAPIVLAFVGMFGVGGLVGTQVFGLASGPASLVAAASGGVGVLIVGQMFRMFLRSEGPEAFSTQDLIGQTARVSVSIPARQYGQIHVTYAGSTQQFTATADTDIPAGTTVTVTGTAGPNLVVAPLN